jgi:hypothetical protein
VKDARDYLSPAKMSKDIVATALSAAQRKWGDSAEPTLAQRSGCSSAAVALIDHHDRANRNLDEELPGGVAREANAAV